MPRLGRPQDNVNRERREVILTRLRAGDTLTMTRAGCLWNGDVADQAKGHTVHAAIGAGVLRVHGRLVVLA